MHAGVRFHALRNSHALDALQPKASVNPMWTSARFHPNGGWSLNKRALPPLGIHPAASQREIISNRNEVMPRSLD